jgi:hypothetical protein
MTSEATNREEEQKDEKFEIDLNSNKDRIVFLFPRPVMQLIFQLSHIDMMIERLTHLRGQMKEL